MCQPDRITRVKQRIIVCACLHTSELGSHVRYVYGGEGWAMACPTIVYICVWMNVQHS